LLWLLHSVFYVVLFCLSGFSPRFTNFRTFISPVLSLTTLPTRCLSSFCYCRLFSACIFYITLSLSFSVLHFFFSHPHSVLASLTAIPHHITPPVNSTRTATVPLSPPPCCLLAHATFASAVSFFFCLFSVRRHWTKPGSFPLHSVHSQHPLHPPSSSFCCTIWFDRYTQPWPFLPHWNLDQTHYHRCWTSELHSYTLLTDQYSP